MYQLPIRGASLPLHEHSAFLLVTGLLHDDLDDQHDTLRGALEIDPLLAAWSVCVADGESGIRLQSIQSTTRWLSRHFSNTLSSSVGLRSLQLPPAQRVEWRKISVRCVSVARRAVQHAHQSKALPLERAFWLGMLLGMKRTLDGYQALNGQSPLHAFKLRWPKWLQDTEQSVRGGDPEGPLSKSLLELDHDELPAGLVTGEEPSLWFRPYPEFHQLAPLLLKKLQRLQKLEERFDETLQAEKLASLQQLAYGASHEINNPLANISTRAQTLMYNESDAERRRKLLAINDQAFRAYEMIADLMLFAKPPNMEVEEVDLGAILEDVRGELTAFAQQRGVTVRVQPDAQPLRLKADATQLGVALVAICKNGVEAMKKGGILTVQARACSQDDSIQVSVEDQGAGMAESVRRHLFDPFFSGREAGRGLGFGLSKAWRIVEQHHGRIEVSGQRSSGSCFVITLPVNGPDARPQPGMPVTKTHD